MADFSKLLPDGDKSARLMDDDCLANFQAIEENGLEPEHDFSTGGTQTGRHKFAIGHRSTLESNAEYVAGSMALADDVCSTGIVPIFKDGDDDWWDVMAPYLANSNLWTAGQSMTPVELTSGASIASDWSESNIFYLDLHNDGALLSNPTGWEVGKSGVYFYIVQQYDAAGYQLTYGSYFHAPGDTAGGTGPLLREGNNQRDILMCTVRPIGGIDIVNLSYSQGSLTEIGSTRYATDAEAAEGEVDNAALTPSNLSSTDMGGGAGSYSDPYWCYMHGHHSTYGQFVMQSAYVQVSSGTPTVIAWNKSFASSSYAVVCSGGLSGYFWWSSRSSINVAVNTSVAGGPYPVCVMAFGPIADI
jgi:hypothetical protein